jgi:tetratricopeptide (TPR) repeat protein
MADIVLVFNHNRPPTVLSGLLKLLHLEQVVALHNPQQHHSLAFLYGFHPEVVPRSLAAVNLWFLGYPDQALKRSQEALTLGQELSRPFGLCFALAWAALLHLFRREGQLAQERAEAAMALASEREFSLVESHKPKVEEAEACFQKAIEIARKQSAKSLELRAVTSLSRLWQQQGKKEKAHEMLSEIYGWFTEGFDTRDLQEAKALLEELT